MAETAASLGDLRTAPVGRLPAASLAVRRPAPSAARRTGINDLGSGLLGLARFAFPGQFLDRQMQGL